MPAQGRPPLHLTFAGSRKRRLAAKLARRQTDTQAKELLQRMGTATGADDLRGTLSEAKPLAAALALQIPQLRPISSIERENLVQDLCRLNVATTVAQERLDKLEGIGHSGRGAAAESAVISRLVSDVLQGRENDPAPGCNEADKAIISAVAARANDFLARLEAAEQRDELVQGASPNKRAPIASRINAAVSAVNAAVAHVSPVRARPPIKNSH